jgi:hypothetical protein
MERSGAASGAQRFVIKAREQMDPLSNADRYLRQAEECIALANVATSNKVRAHHYAAAEHYLRLAEAEPTITDQDAGSDRRNLGADYASASGTH